MPKISAPTLSEHRAAKRAALVSAAESVLRERGVAGVTPGSVCERAGMARSSFYDYFPSRDDVLVAVAIAAFQRWDQKVEAALVGHDSPRARLKTLVELTMRMTAEGEHDISAPLQQANLAPKRYDDLMVMHEALMRPLKRALVELDVPNPERMAVLAQGVLASGMQLVQHGISANVVAKDVFNLLTDGITPS